MWQEHWDGKGKRSVEEHRVIENWYEHSTHAFTHTSIYTAWLSTAIKLMNWVEINNLSTFLAVSIKSRLRCVHLIAEFHSFAFARTKYVRSSVPPPFTELAPIFHIITYIRPWRPNILQTRTSSRVLKVEYGAYIVFANTYTSIFKYMLCMCHLHRTKAEATTNKLNKENVPQSTQWIMCVEHKYIRCKANGNKYLWPCFWNVTRLILSQLL